MSQKKISCSFILLFVFVSSAFGGWFVPDRLSVIDSNTSNFLIRGNLPLENKKFQINQLKRQVQKLTNLKRDSYNLVVISLMNALTPKQAKNKYIQENFFEKHPEYTYKSNIILGSLIDPQTVPKIFRNLIAPIYQYINIDGMDKLLQDLRGYLKSQKATIVYFHCSQGVDRTGYVHAAYSMKYYNKTLQQAYRFNLKVLKNMRNRMHFNTYFGIQWYCLYLGRTQAQCLKGLQTN